VSIIRDGLLWFHKRELDGFLLNGDKRCRHGKMGVGHRTGRSRALVTQKSFGFSQSSHEPLLGYPDGLLHCIPSSRFIAQR
jgi:hypothetical protein